MAPVYDFRHVELDKIGRGKRIVKPPGGECSDIFGVQNGCSPRQEQITPRKANNYMHSNIFSPDTPDSHHSNGQHTPATPAKTLDTQDRLFGGSPDEETPRKIVNRQRSSIFEDEVTDSRSRNTPARRTQVNPITGDSTSENGTPNGSSNGTPNGSFNGTPNGTSKTPRRNQINPITGEPICENGTPNGSPNGTPNGFTNGTNGHMNGHYSPESPMNGSSFRVRNPPGGKSSGIF